MTFCPLQRGCPLSGVIFYMVCIERYVLCWEVCPLSERFHFSLQKVCKCLAFQQTKQNVINFNTHTHTHTHTGSASSLQGAIGSSSTSRSQSSFTNHSSSTYQSSRSSSYQSRTGSARSRENSRDSETTLTRRNMEMLSTLDPEDAENSFDDDSYDDSDGQ